MDGDRDRDRDDRWSGRVRLDRFMVGGVLEK